MRKKTLFISLFSLLYVPYIVLCFYAYPAADDFSYSPSSPFWHSQWNLLMYWNGRYTANFFILANPAIWHSLPAYRLAALMLLTLMPLSFYFVISSAVGRSVSVTVKTMIALLLSSLVLNLFPSLPEAIYWYTGSFTYILGVISALFYAGLVIRYVRGKFIINRNFHLFLSAILLFISVGFNEVQMLILLFGHLFVWLKSDKETRFKSFLFLLFIFSLIFSCIVIFSPGNHYRGSYFTGNYRPFYSFGMTMVQMIRFFFSFLSSGALIVASILFIPISRLLTKRTRIFQTLGNENPFTFLVLLAAILFLCIYPAYWGTGILGQHRTVNTCCCYFIPMWFLFLHSIFTRFGISEKADIFNPKMRLYLTLFLSALIMFTGNSGTALLEFARGDITGFSAEMLSRDKILEAAGNSGAKEITVIPLKNRPQSIFVLDLQPGCTHWINQLEARYFGLDKICLDSAGYTKYQH